MILLKPTSYMNQSGIPVKSALKEFRKTPGDIVVAHDDLDLPLGRFQIKIGGGTGGHRGLESICQSLGTQDFLRFRLGIGRPIQEDAVDYVLADFETQEVEAVEVMIERAAEAYPLLVAEGVGKAMTVFNRQVSPKAKEED